MHAIIPGKVAKAVTKFCSTDVSRPTLRNAVVRGGSLVATNGHILARLPVANLNVPTDHKEWAITPDMLKTPKVSQSLRVNLKSGEVDVVDKYENRVASLLPAAPSVHFPDVDRVLPREDTTFRVGFNPDYLIHVANLAKALGHDKVIVLESVVSEGMGQNRGLRIVTSDGDVLGVLMPHVA